MTDSNQLNGDARDVVQTPGSVPAAAGLIECATCGADMAANASSCVKCGAPNAAMTGEVSTRSMVAAALLCFFLGGFGIHRFYVGKIGTGILMILTLGGLGIWTLIDFVMILLGSFKDKQGLPLRRT